MWEWRSGTALRYVYSRNLIFWWHFVEYRDIPESVQQAFLDRLKPYRIVPGGRHPRGVPNPVINQITAGGASWLPDPILIGTKPARFLSDPTPLFENRLDTIRLSVM